MTEPKGRSACPKALVIARTVAQDLWQHIKQTSSSGYAFKLSLFTDINKSLAPCCNYYKSTPLLTFSTDIIQASLSKPHIDHDNGPRARNNGIYLCLYHLPSICHTLVAEICVCPEMLNVFRYIENMLTCVIYKLHALNDWSYSCLSGRLLMKTGR